MSVEAINNSSAINATQQAAGAQQQDAVKQSQEVVQQTTQKAQEAQKLNAEEMQAIVDKLNEFMHNDQRNLNFSVDKDTDDVVVKVTDVETDEVIRQFPSEEAIKLAKSIEGLMGLIFNDRA